MTLHKNTVIWTPLHIKQKKPKSRTMINNKILTSSTTPSSKTTTANAGIGLFLFRRVADTVLVKWKKLLWVCPCLWWRGGGVTSPSAPRVTTGRVVRLFQWKDRCNASVKWCMESEDHRRRERYPPKDGFSVSTDTLLCFIRCAFMETLSISTDIRLWWILGIVEILGQFSQTAIISTDVVKFSFVYNQTLQGMWSGYHKQEKGVQWWQHRGTIR